MKITSSYDKAQIIYGGDKEFDLLCEELNQHNENKHYLCLTEYQLSFKQLKTILEILKTHAYIKRVNLSSNDVDDQGAIVIAELLLKNNVINCLILNDNPITEVGAKIILYATSYNKCITSISLTGCATGLYIPKKINEKVENNILLAKKIADLLFHEFQNFDQTTKLEHHKSFVTYYYQINEILVKKTITEKFICKLRINKSKKIGYVEKDFNAIKNDCKDGANSKEIWLAVDQYNNNDQLIFEAKNLVTKTIKNFEKCITFNYFLIFGLCKNIYNNETSSLSNLPTEIILKIMSYMKPKDLVYKPHQNVKLPEEYLQKCFLIENLPSKIDQETQHNQSAELTIGGITTLPIYDY